MTTPCLLPVPFQPPTLGPVMEPVCPLSGRLQFVPGPVAAIDQEDDEAGDEEDPAVSPPLSDEESNFDDFDDEFDDDFEEEENDPDWDHPDDAEGDEPPPGKGGGRK